MWTDGQTDDQRIRSNHNKKGGSMCEHIFMLVSFSWLLIFESCLTCTKLYIYITKSLSKDMGNAEISKHNPPNATKEEEMRNK